MANTVKFPPPAITVPPAHDDPRLPFTALQPASPLESPAGPKASDQDHIGASYLRSVEPAPDYYNWATTSVPAAERDEPVLPLQRAGRLVQWPRLASLAATFGFQSKSPTHILAPQNAQGAGSPTASFQPLLRPPRAQPSVASSDSGGRTAPLLATTVLPGPAHLPPQRAAAGAPRAPPSAFRPAPTCLVAVLEEGDGWHTLRPEKASRRPPPMLPPPTSTKMPAAAPPLPFSRKMAAAATVLRAPCTVVFTARVPHPTATVRARILECHLPQHPAPRHCSPPDLRGRPD
ncbi:proline-rich receptor-like protein kinase PERK14 [Brachypodium distachyon]|uniref:proline-rich receptor-like protein kinase PERK14 n=1 Tax=Brachypodium distachyon TaxID=15368 RepID=UPI000D0D27E1|nr:proline-rich receptor-like protein kinase PERK14 [Brachypodium distachyon]|eukprot:XP_024312596.1 proline-rich receptor-like protein kinase PERK14 [Brachypodium distachyon]